MAHVFEEASNALDDGYVQRLLSRPEFWAIAAFSGSDLIGGLTAHTLPMTRKASSEIFVYDIAIREDHRRQGVGRRLMSHLRADAAAVGCQDVFVAADEEDRHALDFYRALGGTASPVFLFTFTPLSS
jgi:aminoglycoside 3-N-acetyltransferase I